MSTTLLNIDHIVLTGFDFTPERAEHIRGLVGQKLQHLIQQEGLGDSFVNCEVSNLSVPMIQPAEMQSDNRLASTLTQRITDALRGVG